MSPSAEHVYDRKIRQAMEREARAVQQPIRNSLSFRIMIRLILPLFALSAIFAGLELSNQINTINQLNKIESQLAVQALYQTISGQAKTADPETYLTDLKNNLEKLKTQHPFETIQIFDLLNKKLLFDENLSSWTSFDFKGVDESLYSYKYQSKPFTIKVDRDTQKIVAFMPFRGFTEADFYIVRAAMPLANIQIALAKSKTTLLAVLFFIMLTGIIIGQSLARSIVSPIKKLNEATRLIMQGQLGKHVQIATGDEIEMLSRTFNEMSDKLIEMKERAEDSNPLTGLPGNQGIFHELSRRILNRQKFVLFHVDLDRFKIFNDHFGLARGDETIKKTAALLKSAVKQKGSTDDFVGHQGGDDFVIITRPNHAQQIAEQVCKQFDSEILAALYRKQDLEQGYILEVDRRRFSETGEEIMAKFPLMAISLAGVSTAKRDFADYFECMSAAVAVKKETKKTPTSSYLIKE